MNVKNSIFVCDKSEGSRNMLFDPAFLGFGITDVLGGVILCCGGEGMKAWSLRWLPLDKKPAG